MILLGLTGAIASGKSTTAAMFAEAGIPVFSADAAVHELYRGAVVPLVEQAFPGTTVDGAVDRGLLAAALGREEGGMKRLETLIHPLVRAEQTAFVERCRRAGHRIALVEMPLLFEVGAEGAFDAVIVTDVPEDVRRQRTLSRPGMNADLYALLSSRQLPAAEKSRRADYVVDTGAGIDATRDAVRHIVSVLSVADET